MFKAKQKEGMALSLICADPFYTAEGLLFCWAQSLPLAEIHILFISPLLV